MYSIREKITHLRSLHAPTHADSDLELLAKLSPKHEELHIFQLSPTRYAENILSALLDVAPAEDIRNNRRSPDDKTKEVKTKESKPEPKAKAKPKAKAEPKAENKQPEQEIKPDDQENKTVKAEKKSSKKKTSTPKSTGATSKTATSK